MKDRHPKQIGSRSGALNADVERGRGNDPEEFALEMEEIELVQPKQGSRNRRATSNRSTKSRPEVNRNSRGRQRATGPQTAGERKQSDRGQGISNRKAATEKKRQQKVVSIRPSRKRAS
jgi:hypothetical protein